jgi:hypothetical protein
MLCTKRAVWIPHIHEEKDDMYIFELTKTCLASDVKSQKIL